MKGGETKEGSKGVETERGEIWEWREKKGRTEEGRGSSLVRGSLAESRRAREEVDEEERSKIEKGREEATEETRSKRSRKGQRK